MRSGYGCPRDCTEVGEASLYKGAVVLPRPSPEGTVVRSESEVGEVLAAASLIVLAESEVGRASLYKARAAGEDSLDLMFVELNRECQDQ